MLKKILLFVFIFITPVYGAQIVNVEYIHKLIKQVHDIDISYSPNLYSEKQAANMKYLLTAVDAANAKLNNRKTTDYGNGEFATMYAVDTIATNSAVKNLITLQEPYFSFRIRANDYMEDARPCYGLAIGAAGNFKIDWGDGTVETITKTNTESVQYSHVYNGVAAGHRVKIMGRATAYSSDEFGYGEAISMYSASPTSECEPINKEYSLFYQQPLSDLRGCLGCVFPTLSDGTQPNFSTSFMLSFQAGYNTQIPDNFFAGISTETENPPIMGGMFRHCAGLIGPSARIDGKYLYEIWPNATYRQVGAMYYGATGLDDYENIPMNWKTWDI